MYVGYYILYNIYNIYGLLYIMYYILYIYIYREYISVTTPSPKPLLFMPLSRALLKVVGQKSDQENRKGTK